MAARHPAQAIDLLKADHRKTNDLFKQYGTIHDPAMKQQIAHEVFRALDIHATLEEELFYPAFADAVDEAGKNLVENARQDHRMVKDMITELHELHDAAFETKFYELMEDVQNHVLEEEAMLFPQAKEMLTEVMAELVIRMQALKSQLLTQ
jgi:hemerythrin superfamily protein